MLFTIKCAILYCDQPSIIWIYIWTSLCIITIKSTIRYFYRYTILTIYWSSFLIIGFIILKLTILYIQWIFINWKTPSILLCYVFTKVWILNYYLIITIYFFRYGIKYASISCTVTFKYTFWNTYHMNIFNKKHTSLFCIIISELWFLDLNLTSRLILSSLQMNTHTIISKLWVLNCKIIKLFYFQ